MRPIDKIIVHCSATPPDMDIGVEEIRPWHLERGMSDIGYNKVIRRNGVMEQGRPDSIVGAHAKGFNTTSIGVCLVGGIDKDGKPDFNFTMSQMKTLYEYLFECSIVDYPKAKQLGHRDLPGVTKACPCFDVRSWLGK